MLRVFLIILIASASLWSSDSHCPAYPSSAWSLQSDRTSAEVGAQSFASRIHEAEAISVQSANFVDDYIFSKMAADGVAPAAPATDAEFLRRVSLDLTGR